MRLVRRLLLALQAGVLVSVGGLVAPTLFAILDNRLVAGRIAGEIFRRTTFLTIALGLAVFILASAEPPAASIARRLRVLLPAALLCLSEFAVRPMIEAARAAQGPASTAFIAWHSVSTAVFITATVAAVVLVCIDDCRPRTP